MQPGRLLSAGVRRVAITLVQNPGRRWRRRLLIVRLRTLAWITRSDLDLKIDKDVSVGKRVAIEFGNGKAVKLHIGPRCKLGDGVLLRLRGGVLDIGEQVDVRGGAVLSIDNGKLVFDGPNNISWSVTIHCAESIHLARFAHVAEFSTIVDNSHFYTEEDVWSYRNTKTAPIDLGVDVWVCPKATITSGVTIGDHTIVASNTVVVKDVPSGVLLSGVPGKIVKELDLSWKK